MSGLAGIAAGWAAWKAAEGLERPRPWVWAITTGLIVALVVYEFVA